MTFVEVSPKFLGISVGWKKPGDVIVLEKNKKGQPEIQARILDDKTLEIKVDHPTTLVKGETVVDGRSNNLVDSLDFSKIIFPDPKVFSIEKPDTVTLQEQSVSVKKEREQVGKDYKAHPPTIVYYDNKCTLR